MLMMYGDSPSSLAIGDGVSRTMRHPKSGLRCGLARRLVCSDRTASLLSPDRHCLRHFAPHMRLPRPKKHCAAGLRTSDGALMRCAGDPRSYMAR